MQQAPTAPVAPTPAGDKPKEGGGIPYIGSRISLISKTDIRYEGLLFNIDTRQSMVALQSVRSFGTEGRRADHVPPSPQVLQYATFKASEIKDLHVCEAAPPAPAAPQAPQAYSGAPAYPPAPPMPSGPPAAAPQQPDSPAEAAKPSAPVLLTPGSVSSAQQQQKAPSAGLTPEQQQAQQVQMQQAMQQRQQMQEAMQQRQRQAQMQQQAMQQQQQLELQQAMQQRQQMHQQQQQRQQQQQQTSHPSTASAAHADGHPTATAARTIPGMGGHLLKRKERRGSAAPDAGAGPAAASGEFDFAEGLSDFDKQQEFSKLQGEAVQAPKGSYQKSSFFDTISCDALDRLEGQRSRITGAQERKLNTETFGAVGLNNRRNFRGRGRGGRGGRRNGGGYRNGNWDGTPSTSNSSGGGRSRGRNGGSSSANRVAAGP